MKTLMDVVSGVEITSQHALIVFANQLLDHFSPSGVMIFIIPDGGRGNTPDRAVDAIFSPSGLIRLDGRTGTDFSLQPAQHWLRILRKGSKEIKLSRSV